MSLLRTNRFHFPIGKTLRAIHLCFFFVFMLTTFLCWQQGQLFLQGYRTSQSGYLNTMISRLDSKARYEVDNLRYLRRIFVEALHDPLFPKALNISPFSDDIENISSLKTDPIPLSGMIVQGISNNSIGDDFLVKHELYALHRIQDLFSLANTTRDLPGNMYYISRDGQFITSLSSKINSLLIESDNPNQRRGSFILASPFFNPKREPFWTRQNLASGTGMLINSSIPVDFQEQWIGMIGVVFNGQAMQDFLRKSLPAKSYSTYQIFDDRLHPLTEPVGRMDGEQLTDEQKTVIARMMERAATGEHWFGPLYVVWGKMVGTHSVLVSTQNLKQGMREDFGRFSVLLFAMWSVFTLLLWLSHRIICRLVSNMGTMQKEMHWHAWHDDLTGVLNRRGFFAKTAQLSPRYSGYALIQLDLDFFKRVNDKYGHQVGDHVLIHAASCIQQATRAQDILGRLGGEEFCIYLPDTSLDAGIAVAQRIKKFIASSPLELQDGTILTVTASMGVAAHSEQTKHSLEQIQSLADIRLYAAKHRGRNQVSWDGENEVLTT